MHRLSKIFLLSAPFVIILLLASAAPFATSAVSASAFSTPAHALISKSVYGSGEPFCSAGGKPAFCTDTQSHKDYDGNYVGHDEPSALFYSNASGSGNSSTYVLTLPKDPPTLPLTGTWNFQLRPAFWFGMAMCDSQSDPEYTNKCTADSDANIFDDANPASSKWIGHHPGGAYMEMQFYPPGWVLWPAGVSCSATQWCAALNIDSYIFSESTLQYNNGTCRDLVSDEPVNFAYLTRSGVSHAPANPVSVETNPDVLTPNPATDLFMNPGDTLKVDMHDTSNGFTVIITDETTGAHGSMTASTANGFGQIKFDPTGSGCTVLPYNFHPMYATSSEHTRLTWTAHGYNVAFSDEIGHFENCATASTSFPFGCTSGGDGDGDDYFCFNAADSSLVPIGGCLYTDVDWDGIPYAADTWPGTNSDPTTDSQIHSQTVRFTSPLFIPQPSSTNIATANYNRVAFETDVAVLESPYAFNTDPCNIFTGTGCNLPPTGADFYPIYTTGSYKGQCVWQLGGTYIPGTTNNFGGTPSAEYGNPVPFVYQNGSGSIMVYEDFRRVISSNPCNAKLGG